MFGWLQGDPMAAGATGPAWAPMASGTLDWGSLLAMLQANVGSSTGFAQRPGVGYSNPWVTGGNTGFLSFQPLQAPSNDYSSGGGGGGMGSMMNKGGGQTRGSTGGVSLSDTVRSRG